MAKLPAGRIEISPYTSASNCSDCSSEWLAGGIALAALFNVTMPSVAFTTNITESNFRYTQYQARRKTVRIWAEYAPFDLKDELKKRRYRWSDGSDGRPRAWYVDVDEADEGSEIAYLCSEIYGREVDLRTQSVTALTRFSTRN